MLIKTNAHTGPSLHSTLNISRKWKRGPVDYVSIGVGKNGRDIAWSFQSFCSISCYAPEPGDRGDVGAESAWQLVLSLKVMDYAEISKTGCPRSITSCNGTGNRTWRHIYKRWRSQRFYHPLVEFRSARRSGCLFLGAAVKPHLPFTYQNAQNLSPSLRSSYLFQLLIALASFSINCLTFGSFYPSIWMLIIKTHLQILSFFVRHLFSWR